MLFIRVFIFLGLSIKIYGVNTENASLETVVRLIRVDNARVDNASDYDGLAVMVETRVQASNNKYVYGPMHGEASAKPSVKDVMPSNVVWFAECRFNDANKKNEGNFSYGKGECNLYCSVRKDEQIVVDGEYLPIKKDGMKIKQCWPSPIFTAPAPPPPSSYHAALIKKSIFEWKINNTLKTVDDLIPYLNGSRLQSGQMPYYSRTGHTTVPGIENEDVTNCAGFSVRLLKQLKVVSPGYNPYYDYALQKEFRQSSNRSWEYFKLSAAIGVVGAGIGALVGTYLAPGPGTVIGAEEGFKNFTLIGAAIGAAASTPSGVIITRSAYQSLKAEDVIEGLFHYETLKKNPIAVVMIGRLQENNALCNSSFKKYKLGTYTEINDHTSKALYELDGLYK